jgi:hypothetical protein
MLAPRDVEGAGSPRTRRRARDHPTVPPQNARAALLSRRHEEDVAVNVLERTGAVEVQVVL